MSLVQDMRIIIPLLLLVLSVLASCRSAKQTTVQSADTTSVTIQQSTESVTAENVLTALATTTEIELAGVTVEYFPPDSGEQGPRASPRVVSIQSVRAINHTQSTAHEQRMTAEKDTLAIEAWQTTDTATTTRTETDSFPHLRRFLFSLLTATLLLLLVYRKR